MFHMEQICAFAAAVAGLAAAAAPQLPVPLAGDNPTAALECNLGLENALTGYTEQAAWHFSRALAADPACALALCGSILVDKGEKDYSTRLQDLHALLEQYTPTPPETFYLNTLLKLACNETNGAAQDFSAHAEQYRRDAAAACWACMLLHLSGNTQHAINQADSALLRHASEPLLLYTRAALEDTADHVSNTALECAQAAAILMPESAMAQLLYARLLFTRGCLPESCAYFHVAHKLARQDDAARGGQRSYCSVLAGLGEATALAAAGRHEEALALRRSMNADHQAPCSTEAALLYRWETQTLPLRSLILRDKVKKEEINAAVDAARPGKEKDAYANYVACLREALLAANTRDKFTAESLVASARLRLKHLEEARPVSGLHAVLLRRAHYACARALARAQAHMYPDSADIWESSVPPCPQAPGRWLMPAVPQPCGTHP